MQTQNSRRDEGAYVTFLVLKTDFCIGQCHRLQSQGLKEAVITTSFITRLSRVQFESRLRFGRTFETVANETACCGGQFTASILFHSQATAWFNDRSCLGKGNIAAIGLTNWLRLNSWDEVAWWHNNGMMHPHLPQNICTIGLG